ncbi:late competence development ComFB family protein [bacterium]|nr:late competence development ComFB family protein [bacterium]
MKNIEVPPLNQYDFSSLENMWVDLVLEEIKELIEAGKICDCQDCVLDLAAISLNSLTPKYWVMSKYNLYVPPDSFASDPQNRKITRDAVKAALLLVERNPHH